MRLLRFDAAPFYAASAASRNAKSMRKTLSRELQERSMIRAGLALLTLSLLAAGGSPALAQSSRFTELNLDKGCKWDPQAEDGEGACAWCPGLGTIAVRFCESDLRQSVEYGAVPANSGHWASFGQFNHMLPRIEWRLEDGVAYAAIQRRFIENANPDTGVPDKAHEGQVLVISTIATAANPVSCVVAYVDTRANPDANELAHQVADNLARSFACGSDEPQFIGNRGPYAGDPTNSFE
jgi:hypothetical protein